MKTKSVLLFLVVLLSLNFTTKAQHKPTPFYPSDTIWKRTVYRMIDLRFPRNGIMRYFEGAGYRSLMEILLSGLEDYGVDVYNDYIGGEFVNLLTLSEVYKRLGSRIDTIWSEDLDTGEPIMTIEKEPVSLGDIRLFMIIQNYFFVKSNSTFSSEIVAILPIRAYIKDTGGIDEEGNDEEGELAYTDVGWFRFDQLRELLAGEKIKDPANENKFSNYLSKFETGNFDSFIVKINNNYGVGIAYYTIPNAEKDQVVTTQPNIDFMLESHRIEYELFNFEMNLWEY